MSELRVSGKRVNSKDTNREGTLYEVIPPLEVPVVAEKLSPIRVADEEGDYFNDPDKRLEIIERDKWTCQYCGEKLNKGNVTLDHSIPRSKGGTNSSDNLLTCCLTCNSIKSGKTIEEAAPLILENARKRRHKAE